MNRCLAVLLAVLAAASCQNASSRPDAGAPAGTGGGGGSSGSGGAATGGGSGSTGSGGAATGGTGGAVTAGSGGAATAGTGGEAGGSGTDAGQDGPAGTVDAPVDAAGTLEPIRVSGGNPDAADPYHDVRFVGVGLEQWEGAVVTFRVGSETGFWRLGSGQVRIIDGGFDVLLPDANPPTYQLKLAHIDADGNGACDVGEPAFADQSVRSTDFTLTVTPSDLRFRTANSYWCDAVNNWPIPP